MRLIDRVMLAPKTRFAKDAAGRTYRLPGPGARAAELERCTLRYIVDRSASYQCGELLRAEPDLLAPSSPLLRMPAEEFWMEWFEEEFANNSGSYPGGRLAVLVKGEPDGRRGRLSFFYEEGKDGVGMSPLDVYFDLDQYPDIPTGSASRFRVGHRDLPQVDQLLKHAYLSVDESWSKALEVYGEAARRRFVATNAGSVWIALPIMCTFSLLLNHGSVLDEQKSELQRLNNARRRNGHRALLEHVEVSLRLGQRHEPSAAQLGSNDRARPRLHYVRGHPVHRGNKTFWRSPHFRGDIDRPILTRTVQVTGMIANSASAKAPRGPVTNSAMPSKSPTGSSDQAWRLSTLPAESSEDRVSTACMPVADASTSTAMRVLVEVPGASAASGSSNHSS